MALTILFKLCTMLDIDKRKSDEAGLSKKNFGSSKKYENVVKMTVFRLFVENGSNDFDQTRSEDNQFWESPENRMSKKIFVLEIFIHKVEILAKNGKSGV